MFKDALSLVDDVPAFPEQGWTVPPFILCNIADLVVILVDPAVLFVDPIASCRMLPRSSKTLRCS